MNYVCHVFYKLSFSSSQYHPKSCNKNTSKVYIIYVISIHKSWVNNESVGCYWNFATAPRTHKQTAPDLYGRLLTFIVHRCAIGSMTTTINTISTPLSGRTKEWHPFKKPKAACVLPYAWTLYAQGFIFDRFFWMLPWRHPTDFLQQVVLPICSKCRHLNIIHGSYGLVTGIHVVYRIVFSRKKSRWVKYPVSPYHPRIWAADFSHPKKTFSWGRPRWVYYYTRAWYTGRSFGVQCRC